MPELPEVETTRRGIGPLVVGHRVAALKIYDRRLRWPVPKSLEEKLAGRTIDGLDRRSKYLLFRVGGHTLLLHLGMTGSLRAFTEQRRRIAAEHGMSRWGVLPALVHVPIWLALYHLLAGVVAGVPVGAMNTGLVASLGAATVLGVPLAERGYLGGGPVHLVVVTGLALAAALLSFVTQRYFVAPNTVLTDLPGAMVSAHRLMPGISALGLVIAGGFAPVALLMYWVCNSTWTLGQSAIVWWWFPTPGSPAASRESRVDDVATG